MRPRLRYVCIESPFGTTVLIMYQPTTLPNSDFSSLLENPLEENIPPPRRGKKKSRGANFTNLIRGTTSGIAAGSVGPSTPSGSTGTHTDSGTATPSNPPPSTAASTGAAPVAPTFQPPPPAPVVPTFQPPVPTGAAPVAPTSQPPLPAPAAAVASSEPSATAEPRPPSAATTGGSRTVEDLFRQLNDLKREMDARYQTRKIPPEAAFFKSLPKPKPPTVHRQDLLVSCQIIYVDLAVSYKPLGSDAQRCPQAPGYQV